MSVNTHALHHLTQPLPRCNARTFNSAHVPALVYGAGLNTFKGATDFKYHVLVSGFILTVNIDTVVRLG
jgi:hypothetical protein